MVSFGVSNLRRLKSVPPIELKPITILVGKNSSGKSTFLRAFPLLRQSLMTRTSSPVLWYGDLVDFGSFDISVSDKASGQPITFSFLIDHVRSERPESWMFGRKRRPYSEFAYRNVRFDVSIVNSGEKPHISRVFVRSEQPKVVYEIIANAESHVTSVRLNDLDASDLLKIVKLKITAGTILPELTVIRPDEKKGQASGPVFFIEREAGVFFDAVKALLKTRLKRASDAWLARLSFELLSIGPASKKVLRDNLTGGTKLIRTFIADITGSDKKGFYPKLIELLYLANLPAVLTQIRVQLREVITSTLYIGPARARSERYYRYQDLAVSEIDPDGKNFPMFLNSLHPSQISQLSHWIEGLFGYGLNVSRQAGGGHMSIDLVVNGVPSNIVDNGYGVSQILPVLGQIWWARNRPVSRVNPSWSLLAIEQPELHLHPAHQALLADALAGGVAGDSKEPSKANDRIHFLVETHSETLLNRLGELISRKVISSDDVQVIIFESLDDEQRLTDVRTSSFNDDGELINWPYGFFQPTAE